MPHSETLCLTRDRDWGLLMDDLDELNMIIRGVDADQKIDAIGAAVQRRDSRAIPFLLEAMHDDSAWLCRPLLDVYLKVSDSAIWALGKLDAQCAVTRIQGIYRMTADPDTRKYAAIALVDLGVVSLPELASTYPDRSRFPNVCYGINDKEAALTELVRFLNSPQEDKFTKKCIVYHLPRCFGLQVRRGLFSRQYRLSPPKRSWYACICELLRRGVKTVEAEKGKDKVS